MINEQKNYLDKDGYPTDAALENIKTSDDFVGLLDFVSELFEEYGMARWDNKGEKRIYKLATGGWSGNEEIIEAMRSNPIFWLECWYQTRRGGYYEFEVKL